MPFFTPSTNSGTLSLEPMRLQHPQDGLVGAAVQRAVERGDARGRGGVGVDLAGADRADRVGRAVLLVVGVQDEQDVEGLDQPGVGLELALAHLEEHPEEVLGVGQVVVRVDERLALGVPEGPRAERRHLGDQPHDLHVTVVGVGDVARLGVERRQRADGGHQHAHRVGVVAEALHEVADVLVHEGVEGDLVLPRVVLLAGGQLAVDQQVGDLEEVGVLGQLLDRVAAVLQDPLLAVDERHRAPAGGGVDEPGVVDREPGRVLVGLDLADVGGVDGPVQDRHVVRRPGAVVGDGERLALGCALLVRTVGGGSVRGLCHVGSSL